MLNSGLIVDSHCVNGVNSEYTLLEVYKVTNDFEEVWIWRKTSQISWEEGLQMPEVEVEKNYLLWRRNSAKHALSEAKLGNRKTNFIVIICKN